MRQLSLFDPAAGTQARDAGISQVEQRDRVWNEYAYGALEALCRRRQFVHADDLVAACNWEPGHPNAWGAVWMRARRRGLIAEQDPPQWRRSAVAAKHRRNLPVYRSLVYGEGR